MNAWRERSAEEARLLNPAFLSLLLWSAASGYREAAGEDLPFELAFLIAPVILHKPTREALPRSPRTSLAAWIEEHSVARVGLAERAASLSPFVREALLFGAVQGLLRIGSGGRIAATPRPRPMARYLSRSSEEVLVCVKRAEFVARWFSLAGSVTTVMALWGVKP
jgi:hypothetical protein